jgi:hypothetical protein
VMLEAFENMRISAYTAALMGWWLRKFFGNPVNNERAPGARWRFYARRAGGASREMRLDCRGRNGKKKPFGVLAEGLVSENSRDGGI